MCNDPKEDSFNVIARQAEVLGGMEKELDFLYVELVKAAGGDLAVLPEAWQQRFLLNFPKSSIYREEAAKAEAQKETVTRGNG